jgi:uncharacterized membrane protein HdeD (DUF308 family)
MSAGGASPYGPGTAGPGDVYVQRHFPVTGASLRRASGWLLFLGIALIVLGTFALIVPVFPTVVVVIIYGWVLLFAGVSHAITAFVSRMWGGFFLNVLMAVIDIVLGVFFLRHWAQGAAVITLLLAAGFLVGGTFRLVAAFSMRFPSWGWAALSGAISILLGIYLFADWPRDSFVIPGLFLGIQMLFIGWSSVMLALSARSHPG